MKLCFGLAFAFLFSGSVYGSAFDSDITRLNRITYDAPQARVVDITLNRESFEEQCYVRAPNSELINVDELTMEGVKVQAKSDYVACRLSIGPMTEDLAGSWELCGKSVATEETRCQPVTITIGTGQWLRSNERSFDHPVHFGGSVNSGIMGSGYIQTCHVITPAGEDLIITPDTRYPHIERSTVNNNGLCSVLIKDITENMLGNWMVYGIFLHPVFGWYNEVQRSLTFNIYNEDNPYDQAYNLTGTQHREHVVDIGTDLKENVTHRTGEVQECIYRSPSGQIFDLDSYKSKAPEGVFVSGSEKGICGIDFKPVTNEVIGEWLITGKFKNGPLFDETHLTFRIVKTEPVDDNLTLLSQINHFTTQQTMIEVSLSNEEFEEECFVRPPYGELISVDHHIEGVTPQSKSKFVSCRVIIGPMTQNLLGVWRLCGRSGVKTRCQPVSIEWNSNDPNGPWTNRTVEPFAHPVHFRGSVNSGVSGAGGVTTCHVVTPSGEDLVITPDTTYPHIERSTLANPSLCSVVIKDITEDMLGDWRIYGVFRDLLRTLTHVHLPLTFNLYNEDDPYEQAYNVTVVAGRQQLVHVGTELSFEVSHRVGTVRDCIYTSPSGQTFHLKDQDIAPEGVIFHGPSTGAVCRITFKPITKYALGEWEIAGKFSNGILFNENLLTFEIIQEDPDNPLVENVQRVIENMTEQFIVAEMNTVRSVVINTGLAYNAESCHLITPSGRQYAFIPGFNVPNVEIINRSGVECGVSINIAAENMIGEWILLARSTRSSVPVERRLHFNVRGEENFVIKKDIHIKEGGDLYLHLNDAISSPETCTLIGPDGKEYTNVETDLMFTASCGFIVRHVDHGHNGTWIIEHGAKIKRRGSVSVQVLDALDLSLDNMRWALGDSIDISIGPENAIYCMIQDANGRRVFDNFGQCKIVLDRVTDDHSGTWKMSVGVAGSVRLHEYGFYVNVFTRGSGESPVVTSVQRNAPSVVLTCAMPAQHEVNACKFRDPQGNVLVASHGVGQDGYTFNGVSVNYESVAESQDCTLRITNPSASDVGIWRCALDTATETHYGFLTVKDQETSAEIQPQWESTTSNLFFEGDTVTLSCSVSAPLRYCYFRAAGYNGSIYTVFPGMPVTGNAGYDYYGAGLNAGECGIRFQRFLESDSGEWSCHAGLMNSNAEELRTTVIANVRARVTSRLYFNEANTLVVQAQAYNDQPIEYCRFVRINGHGFTSDNVPEGYHLQPTLHRGLCALYVDDASILNRHPWAVVVKLQGVAGEIQVTTRDNLLTFPTTPAPETSTSTDHPTTQPPVGAAPKPFYGEVLFWVLIAIIILISLTAAFALIPKKNRERTRRRASRISDSFRRSWDNTFKKTSAPPQYENEVQNRV